MVSTKKTNKTKKNLGRTRLLRLPGQRIEEDAEYFAETISKLLNSVFPGLKFQFDIKQRTSTFTDGTKAEVYAPTTRMSYEKIRAIMSYGILEPRAIDVLVDAA